MSMMLRRRWIALGLGFVLSACTIEEAGPAEPPQRPQQTADAPKTAKLDAAQAQRLQRIMEPLIARMDKPIPRSEVKITVLDDEGINAANGGGGDFYVTTGLMAKANDEQLRGIMAHEVAHADLGHVASTQKLATGLQLGMILLDQIYPGASSLTPIAGQLIVNAYTRGEEHEADAHGVELLKRTGQNGKAIMANTLSWLEKTSGGGGGFFSTHPATGDRVEAVQKLP